MPCAAFATFREALLKMPEIAPCSASEIIAGCQPSVPPTPVEAPMSSEPEIDDEIAMLPAETTFPLIFTELFTVETPIAPATEIAPLSSDVASAATEKLLSVVAAIFMSSASAAGTAKPAPSTKARKSASSASAETSVSAVERTVAPFAIETSQSVLCTPSASETSYLSAPAHCPKSSLL